MSTAQWQKQNLKMYPIRFNYNTGIPAALEKAAQDMGVQPSEYMRKAVIDRLIEDGYLQQDSAYAGPHGTLKLPKD